MNGCWDEWCRCAIWRVLLSVWANEKPGSDWWKFEHVPSRAAVPSLSWTGDAMVCQTIKLMYLHTSVRVRVVLRNCCIWSSALPKLHWTHLTKQSMLFLQSPPPILIPAPSCCKLVIYHLCLSFHVPVVSLTKPSIVRLLTLICPSFSLLCDLFFLPK